MNLLIMFRQRRLFIKNNVIVFVLTFFLCCSEAAAQLHCRIDSLIFDIETVLEIEKQYGIEGSTKKALSKFIKIFEDVEKAFIKESSYDKNDVIEYFKLVNEAIEKNDISTSSNFFITPELSNKRSFLDCDNLSLIYISIALRLDLPIYPVYAPKHVFIRWLFEDGSYYNWDPRGKAHHPDSYYIQIFDISETAINKGVYLSNVSLNRALACLNTDLAIREMEAERYDSAMVLVDKVLGIDSLFMNASLTKASIHKLQGEPEEAVDIYENLKDLDSLELRVYLRQARLLLDIFQSERAEKEIKEYIEICVNHDEFLSLPYCEAITLLGESYIRQQKFAEARELFYGLPSDFDRKYFLDFRELFDKYGVVY